MRIFFEGWQKEGANEKTKWITTTRDVLALTTVQLEWTQKRRERKLKKYVFPPLAAPPHRPWVPGSAGPTTLATSPVTGSWRHYVPPNPDTASLTPDAFHGTKRPRRACATPHMPAWMRERRRHLLDSIDPPPYSHGNAFHAGEECSTFCWTLLEKNAQHFDLDVSIIVTFQCQHFVCSISTLCPQILSIVNNNVESAISKCLRK